VAVTLRVMRAPGLPRGTVSLLFTDIEGSTQLTHRLGERDREVVNEHRRLLEAAFEENAGIVVDRISELACFLNCKRRDHEPGERRDLHRRPHRRP
jgi:hypothetical protein